MLLLESMILLALCLALVCMANVHRHRWGPTMPVSHPFKSGVAVFIGDLCYRDASDSYKLKPAGSFTWQSAVSTPSAPTVTNTTTTLATGLTNALTGVKVSYQFPWGEGTLSSAGTATPTAQAGLLLAGLAVPSPAIGVNVYVESSAGSGTYKLYAQYAVQPGQQGIGNQLIVGYGTGQVPPGSPAAQDATAVSQYTFRQSFAGVSEQCYDGTNDSAYGIKDGKLRASQSGVYEFDCASASFNVGDLVGPAKQSGNALEPQKVVAVTHELLAIGRVVEGTSSQTTVKVEIAAPLRSLLS